MTLHSDRLWRIAADEQPPFAPSADLASVKVGMALGLSAIDALGAGGTNVGPVKHRLPHHQLVGPVEADTILRWRAAHSDCFPAARSWNCSAGGCTGLWVTHPGSERAAATPASALHEALRLARPRLRRVSGTHHPRHEEACCA